MIYDFTMTWELTGVPYTSAREPGGIAEAIGVLRDCGLAERLARLGFEDAGDLELDAPSGERGAGGLLNEGALAELFEAGEARVGEARMRGRRPLPRLQTPRLRTGRSHQCS